MRGDAVGYLALHHDDSASEQPLSSYGEEVQQDVRGDVVWQVADDVYGLAFGELGEIGLEDVGVVNGDVRIVAEAEGQLAGEGRVELDAVQACAAGSEEVGDGSVAGADFDDGALAYIAEGFGDAEAGVLVDEEVLS
jgi:hypothetical protein